MYLLGLLSQWFVLHGPDRAEGMVGLVLIALAAAASGSEATKKVPAWKARASASSWAGARAAVLWRGMHYGTYKSERHRGKMITVNGNHWSVHENHLKKVVAPLRKAGANVTVFACSHASEVTEDWLARAGVAEERADVILKDHKKQIRPNDLLRRAYALVARSDWDVLLSFRADIVLKRDVVDLMRRDRSAGSDASPVLWLPFREVYIGQAHACSFREKRASDACVRPWAKHGMRFSDAVLVMPRHMLPDVEYALGELIKHKVWDQHTLALHLYKGRHYDVERNVSALLDGFWDSNVDRHSNPLFSLARGKAYLSQLAKRPEPDAGKTARPRGWPRRRR